MIKRCDFRARRKEVCESISLMLTGRLFQMSGPQTEKARRPNWVLVRRTTADLVVVDRSWRRRGPLALNVTRSLRYGGERLPWHCALNWKSETESIHFLASGKHDWCESRGRVASQVMSQRGRVSSPVTSHESTTLVFNTLMVRVVNALTQFYRAACNATHGIAVAILSVRLSVCLSVRCVYCDKTKWCTADILIPHETAIALVFWQQHWLVGSSAFPSNIRRKWSTPFEKRRLWPISVYNVSTVRDSEKKFNYQEYKVDHALSNKL